MSRLLRASAAGVGIGGAAAVLYKYSNAPLLPQFMSDPAVGELREARAAQTVKLTELLRTAAPAIDAAGARAEVTCGTLDVQCRRARAAASAEHARLRKELKEAAAALTYGLPNDGRAAEERDAYVAQYGCVAWTDEALAVVAARGKIVEVGAGHGQWARALRRAGADVCALLKLLMEPSSERGTRSPSPHVLTAALCRCSHTTMAPHSPPCPAAAMSPMAPALKV